MVRWRKKRPSIPPEDLPGGSAAVGGSDSPSRPAMDSSPNGSGGAFLAGGLVRGGSGGSGKGSSGCGIGGDSSSAIGGDGASADAWTRLASSGVEDDLAFPPEDLPGGSAAVGGSDSPSRPAMDSSPHGSGGAFLAGGLGCGGSGGSGKGSSGCGIGGDSSSAIGGGGASADAWTRLASSGVEDDLAFPVGCGGGGAGSGPGGMPYGHFLDACFLCRKPIASNRDIFMYRGDIPFCSEECRMEQMEADEDLERKEKNTAKKMSPRPASLGEVESPPRPPKTRAGSILAG